jgi:hypothetical protein
MILSGNIFLFGILLTPFAFSRSSVSSDHAGIAPRLERAHPYAMVDAALSLLRARLQRRYKTRPTLQRRIRASILYETVLSSNDDMRVFGHQG